MPDSIMLLAIGAITFLFFSSFFSGLEAAYLSLDRVAINRLESSKHFLSRLTLYFFRRINHFLFSLLSFNLFNNIMATLFGSALAKQVLIRSEVSWFQSLEFQNLFLDVFFVIFFTIILVVFSELIPKKVAIKHPRLFALIGTLPMTPIYFAILPFIYSTGVVSASIRKLLMGNSKNGEESNHVNELFHKQELMGYVDRIFKSEGFKASEGYLLKSVIENMNTQVSSLILNREKIEGLDVKSLNGGNLITTIREFPKPYIVLYRENKDNILGVVSKRKLMFFPTNKRGKEVRSSKNEKNIKTNSTSLNQLITKEDLIKAANEPVMVPESKHVLDVLQDIYYSKSEVAVVTDEHGGIEGVVSETDILEKIFESVSAVEDRSITEHKDGDGYFVVKAETSISTVNEFFNVRLSCEETESIGGYFLEKIRHIPKKGFEYKDEFFYYRVRSRNSKKIISLELKKIIR